MGNSTVLASYFRLLSCVSSCETYEKREIAEQKHTIQSQKNIDFITTNDLSLEPKGPVFVDGIKTALEPQSQTSKFEDSSMRVVSRQTGYSYSTVRKVFRKHNELLPIHNPPNPGSA
ncbi:hypothetical protein TNCV_1597101 [Trichonephila clavipes]|nr:hypothetical protein TNCV_1597101 [Trichonephila clavipes]